MKATITGNTTGIYTDPKTLESHINPASCQNYRKVNFEGVNHLIINRDNAGNMHIIQASGYTPEKGLFCNLY